MSDDLVSVGERLLINLGSRIETAVRISERARSSDLFESDPAFPLTTLLRRVAPHEDDVNNTMWATIPAASIPRALDRRYFHSMAKHIR